MNAELNEVIALAESFNDDFLYSKIANNDSRFIKSSFEFYKEVQNLGRDSLTNIYKANLAIVGAAFYRMACFINYKDEDINSICAENAFYCLAKAIKEEYQYVSAPHLFCLLQYDKSNWGNWDGRLLKEKKDRISIMMPIRKDIHSDIYALHFIEIFQFYIISLVCKIEDDGYAIAPAVFCDNELKHEDIERVIVFILRQYPNMKDKILEIGKYMFDELYIEIQSTLKNL